VARAAAVLFVVSFVLQACEPGPPAPEPVAIAYANAWVKSDYQAMWSLLTPGSQQKVGTAGFIGRLPKIAQEMTLTSLDAKVGQALHPRLPDGSPDPRSATIPLSVTFHTARVGDVSRDTQLHLVLQGDKQDAKWLIDWGPEAILPGLTTGRLVRMTRLPTTRGRIITRDGTELATFTDGTEVGVVPGQIRDEAAMLASLAIVVGLKPEDIKARYTQSWVKPDTYVAIKTLRDLAADARAKLSVIEGVQLRPIRLRSYPSGLLSQILGTVGEATDDDAAKLAARGVQAGDTIGKSGLEQSLDEYLMGTYGWRLGIVDESEHPIETLAETPASPGLDAVLSIDPAMQRAADAALGGQKGAIVVEDPWSGEILVLATSPNTDQFDRATFGQYATGSTFKLVTSAAALRTGALKPGEKVDCPYRWTGYGPNWVQVNHETSDLGLIDLHTALARSCNSFFYEMGKRLNDMDPNILPNEAKSFGLGSGTDVDFVYEAEGIVPSPEWKKTHVPDSPQWNPGDATNLAIGQGYLLATPLQMANYVSAVANDGTVWKPRLVVELRDRTGTVVKTFPKTAKGTALTKPTDLSLIRDGMRAVVAEPDGTVYFPWRSYGVAVAGKSGTAETPTGRVNAWFIGFAPYDGPRLAVATVFEQYNEYPGHYGSQDAATATRKVFSIRLPG
jgi:cell division protein FtsI/penicillin-binding protein 2